MKESHKGALLDLDGKSRESVPSRRARLSKDWISLSGRRAREEKTTEGENRHRAWLPFLPLCLAAFRAGRFPLLRKVAMCRCNLFQEPVRLNHFLAINYIAPPASLLNELAWLRDLGVRQVVLPLEQNEFDVQQVKALGAIQNLHAEDCRISAVLRQRRGAQAEPEAWHRFCHGILAQVGWQLECAQLGEDLDGFVREYKDIADFAKLFSQVPRLRRDYPGVALLAPGMERFDTPLPVQALQRLLPEGYAWDGVTVQAPAWQALESVGRDNVFLRRLALVGAVALRPEIGGGKVRVVFPPPPSGCDAAAEERIAGSVVRRTVLALTSGVADRAVISMDPETRVAERRILSTAVREVAAQLEGARFEQRVRVGDDSRDFVMEFTRADKPPVLVGWTDGEPRLVPVPFRVGEANDYLRRPVPMLPHPRIRLTRQMAYFVGGGA